MRNKVNTKNMCRLFNIHVLSIDLWCEDVEQVLAMIYLLLFTYSAITTQISYLRWEKSMSLQKENIVVVRHF